MRMLIGLTRRFIKFLNVNYINSNVSAANRIAHARCIFAVQLTDVVESGGVNQRNFPDVSKTAAADNRTVLFFSAPFDVLAVRDQQVKNTCLAAAHLTEQNNMPILTADFARINSYVS